MDNDGKVRYAAFNGKNERKQGFVLGELLVNFGGPACMCILSRSPLKGAVYRSIPGVRGG